MYRYIDPPHTHTHTQDLVSNIGVARAGFPNMAASACVGAPLLNILLVRHAATRCDTLPHTATHCNTLQHTATPCNTLSYTSAHCDIMMLCRSATHCNTLHHTTTHCNALQHTATHCNTLQHTTTHCNTLSDTSAHCNIMMLCRFSISADMSWHTATHCNTLQRTATRCNTNTLQHTATHCNTLCWRSAAQSNVLQCADRAVRAVGRPYESLPHVLQHTVAAHCNNMSIWHHTGVAAIGRSSGPRSSVSCSVLQCVAVCCSRR